MFYKIIDIQKFLLSKQIFWDGKINDERGKWRPATQLDFEESFSGENCKMIFMNEDSVNARGVILNVNDCSLEINEERWAFKQINTTTLYDFSEEWMQFRLQDKNFAKYLAEQSESKTKYFTGKRDGEIELLKKQMQTINESYNSEIQFWSKVNKMANDAIKNDEMTK